MAYFNPHSFWKTLAEFGERACETSEAFKAWSQNLGHENVLTTFVSYGQVATPRQAELIRKLGKPKSEDRNIPSLGTAAGDAGKSMAHRFRITSHGPKINRISLRWYTCGTPPIKQRTSEYVQFKSHI